jgi:hypothetical protein
MTITRSEGYSLRSRSKERTPAGLKDPSREPRDHFSLKIVGSTYTPGNDQSGSN